MRYKNNTFYDARFLIKIIFKGTHAREWISPATVSYIVRQLVENRANYTFANNVDFYILPVVNPDGYEYSRSGNRLWRKNRNKNNTKCVGVDLNRNFGYKWGGAGASKDPCQETYAGPGPFSEPESQAVRDFVTTLGASVKVTYFCIVLLLLKSELYFYI